MPGASASRAYHHGDLRRALVDAAIPLIRKGGAEALTLRAVARAAGVSQTAPYRHFADRAALVAAVADRGFERLHARLIEAVKVPARTTGRGRQTARGGLQAIAVAYVRFALDQPEEYRIMFGPEISAAEKSSESRARVFAFLQQGIEMLQERKLVRAGDPHAMALAAWSLVHGLAMLMIDGQLGSTKSSIELTIQSTDLMMFGMAKD